MIRYKRVGFAAALLFLPFQSVFSQQLLTIRESKLLPLGSQVTVRGRISAGNELGGPAFMQDATAGIAVYSTAFHAAVQLGDSVEVSGTTSEFSPSSGVAGSGLFQISGTVSFTVFPEERKQVEPLLKRISDITEADEGLLVQINNVRINAFELFSGNRNYFFGDGKNFSEMRVYASTDLSGQKAVSGPLNLRVLVSQFRGGRQFIPRSYSDLTPIGLPSAVLPVSETFDVVTWNIEWLGDLQNGPSNETLQVQRAAQTMNAIGADVFALQEISDATQFRNLISLMPGYKGFMAGYSISQNTAFLYNTTTVDSVFAGVIPFNSPTTTNNPFASRFPLQFSIRTKIPGRASETVHLINIHAKAFADLDAYNRRSEASTLLKNYLDVTFPSEKTILLGDFNDDLDESTFNERSSPYSNFVSDTVRWLTPTLPLSLSRISSYYTGSDLIDHAVFSDEFRETLLSEDTHIYNVATIPDFSSTTSDHYPVLFRVYFPPATAAEHPELQKSRFKARNFPNPFNPQTTIVIFSERQQRFLVQVFDLSGRILVTMNDVKLNAGETGTIPLNMSGFSTGLYFCNIQSSSGHNQLLKLTLLK